MPFDEDLAPDTDRLIAQCKWLLSQNVNIAVFGTNSEANSLSVDEKIDLLDALIDSEIDPKTLMPGTGLCALPDTIRLTRHVARRDCGGALMLPPFYYKGVSDEGLFRAFSEVIERVGDSRLRVYLYHIPPVAQVGLSLALVERLVSRYPGTVVGIKDSSGDWQNTSALIRAEMDDFQVLTGTESNLLDSMRLGAAGCISATANINPAAIHNLYTNWQAETAEEMQRALAEFRDFIQSFPVIPALKATVSRYRGDDEWRRLRPPLVELDEESCNRLYSELDKRHFAMPGIAQAA